MNSIVTGQPHRTFAGALSRVGHFVLHFLEMCIVAMCLGGIMILGGLFFFVAARLGYPDIRHQAPGVTLAVTAFNLTLAMIIWMRLRRHDWRATLEMAAPTPALAAVAFALSAAGVTALPNIGTFCGIACALMLVPMLLRVDMYSGGHHH